jgi:hypothetical protein
MYAFHISEGQETATIVRNLNLNRNVPPMKNKEENKRLLTILLIPVSVLQFIRETL